MFKKQQEWVRSASPIEPLKQYALLSGMSAGDVEACLKNDALLKIIKEEQNKATSLYKVQATPTFYIGDEKLDGLAPGDQGYAQFAKVLDKQLAKVK